MSNVESKGNKALDLLPDDDPHKRYSLTNLGGWKVIVTEQRSYSGETAKSAAEAAVEGEEASTLGLREALRLLNAYRDIWRDSEPSEPPFFAATNALIREISVREGKSIKDIVSELSQP